METILIITKKEMFSGSSRNYIRNKVRKLYIYIYIYVKVKKKGIFKVFINLKTNEKPMINN